MRPLAERGSFQLRSEDDVRRVLLLLQARSRGVPRTLRLLDASGRVLAQETVGTAITSLAFGPLPVHAPSMRFYLDAMPPVASEPDVLVTTPVAQPLADFSVSLREQR